MRQHEHDVTSTKADHLRAQKALSSQEEHFNEKDIHNETLMESLKNEIKTLLKSQDTSRDEISRLHNAWEYTEARCVTLEEEHDICRQKLTGRSEELHAACQHYQDREAYT